MNHFRNRLFACLAAVFFAAVTFSLRAQCAEPRTLRNVLEEVERRFDVRIGCKRFDPDTLRIAHAEARMRPYSLAETLDGLLTPLDLVWRGERKITVQPFEYYRRTPADGEKLLAWLSAQYADREAWERRRDTLLRDVRRRLDLGPFRRGLVADPAVRLGKIVRHDGYTTQNYALETLRGLYVCGTIYAPDSKTPVGDVAGDGVPEEPAGVKRVSGSAVSVRSTSEKNVADKGASVCAVESVKTSGVPPTCGVYKRPLIVSPAGHWEGGRYRPDQQLRMATFARMGAVAVDMDIFGWGDSERQVGRQAHTAAYAMQIQVLWSVVVTEWMLRLRDDIDTMRMAATGGSGGATHTLLLAVEDDRFAVLAPVVHLVSHFDGGCPCESGRPVAQAAGGSCMPEILAAAMAPRPVLAVSDGGDWTATYPALEYPFLKRIWGFYGAEERIRNVHFPDERHDYGVNKRRAVYEFFARELGLDAGRADETRVELQPEEALGSFGGGLPAGAIRSCEELERIIENLK